MSIKSKMMNSYCGAIVTGGSYGALMIMAIAGTLLGAYEGMVGVVTQKPVFGAAGFLMASGSFVAAAGCFKGVMNVSETFKHSAMGTLAAVAGIVSMETAIVMSEPVQTLTDTNASFNEHLVHTAKRMIPGV